MISILRRPRAEEDLLEIWNYVARDDIAAADKLLDQIQVKLELAAGRPLIGRDRSDLADALRSLTSGNYVLFYRPFDSGAELVRVLSRFRDVDFVDFGS